MFSCCKKQKKINNEFDSKINRKSSDGELIFEDIQKIRAIMMDRNTKIESTTVNRTHTQ